MTFRRRLRDILQLIAVAFFFIAPFITTSNGNSLARFDFATIQIYLFNKVISFNDFFTFSLLILFLTFFFIITTQIFGRVWCAWLCPQNLYLNFINKFPKKLNIFIALVLSIIIGLFSIFYFVSVYDFCYTFENYSKFVITLWIILSATVFLFLGVFKYNWCKYVCPYAKMQSLMSDDNSLFVGMLDGEGEKCIKCLACIKTCPTKIDPRNNPNNACINCEKCIDSCEKVLKRKGGKSILGLRWGYANKFTLFRVNVFITFIITAGLFIFLISSMFTKTFEVKLDDVESTTFELKVKNKSSENIIVRLKSKDKVTFEPEVFSIRAKDKVKLHVTYRANQDEFEFTVTTNKKFHKEFKIKRNR